MEQTPIPVEENRTGSSFDISRFFSKLLSNYYWFILTIAIAGTSAYLYLRYTQPLYEVSTFLLVSRPNDAMASTLGGSTFAGGGAPQQAVGPMTGADASNEIFKLQSEVLLGQVVDSLQLDVSAVRFGRVRSKAEDLENLPFTVKVIKSSPESSLPVHKLFLTETSYSLQSEKKNIKGYYGQPLLINGDTLIITLKSYAPQDFNTIYGLELSKRAAAVSQLSSRITVQPAAKAGPGMLQIMVRDEIPYRAKKIIDVLKDKYDIANLEFKNQSLKKEIDFLSERVATVGNELLHQENLIRDFKVSNKVTDVSASASQLLSNLTALDTKKNENEAKRQMAELVESNIRNSSGQEQVISNVNLGDPVLGGLVGKYNDKVLEKNRILDKGTALDPRLGGVNRELQDLRISILSSVENVKREIRSSNEFLASQERTTTSRFQTMPEKEKDYVQVNRLLALKQTQYMFLLQKKEDKAIQLVSSQIGESRIIDSRTNNDILYPKRWLIYAIALGAAFLLPALIILLRMLLNKRIETRKDIENATFLPIAGEIELEPRSAREIIVSAGYQTDIAEQFRSLRTNLIYLKQETAGKVLMVTSAMPGEGKSFVSINLANTLASTGKKVILVELDLRRPQLAKTLGLNTRPGMTDFLITTDMLPHDVIQSNREYDNLSFVTCGPVPPNPGELILTKRLQSFFDYLRSNYDIIVVDTPPVGIVSDAIIIGGQADLTLFILRHRYSYRSSVQLLNDLHDQKKLPHLSIVINSIKRNKGFQKEIQGSYNYYLRDDKKQKRKNGVHTTPKKESTTV